MTRRLRCALTAAAAAVVLLALPAAASALVGGPYQLTGAGANLAASPAAGGSTLVVQAQRTVAGVEFSPAAVNTVLTPLPAGCDNVTVPGKTTCTPGSLSTSLSFSGAAVEVQVHGVATTTLTFTGGTAGDSFLVDGAGPITLVQVDPRAGADSISVAGNVAVFSLLGLDPGDDRYDLQSPGLVGPTVPGPTLALGDGNDVASNRSPGLTIDGGAGADTLSGAGPLVGNTGDDLLEPTVTGQNADGGPGSDRLSFDLINTPLVLTKSGTNVQAGGVTKTGIDILEGGQKDDTITGDGGADDLAGGDGDDTIVGGGGGDKLDGGPGLNTVSYATGPSPISVDLVAGTATPIGGGPVDHLTAFRRVITGPGNDTVLGTAADESFSLGAGDDTVNAGPGNDSIDGGPGDDLLRGGHGTDSIDGGPGRDTATYDERTVSEPISVTLATPGDDGGPGENDTLAGIEDVVGGASSDVLVGDAGPNQLVGGGGLNTIDGGAGDDVLIGGDFRDVIVGGPGRDVLVGGGDDDSLSAFDGEADVVDCGPSADDDAQVDAADQVSGCEFSSRGDVPVPVDADHDGTVAGFDCDDNNPAIGLTATDIPGDGIDQNCDGFDEPLALVAGLIGYGFDPPTSRGTRMNRLVLTQLPGGSTVVVTCKTAIKRKCPFTRATRRPASGGGRLSLTALLKRRVLPVGTQIELRITAPGVIGHVRRFTVRRLAALRTADLCVLPTSSVAKKCPPDVL